MNFWNDSWDHFSSIWKAAFLARLVALQFNLNNILKFLQGTIYFSDEVNRVIFLKVGNIKSVKVVNIFNWSVQRVDKRGDEAF